MVYSYLAEHHVKIGTVLATVLTGEYAGTHCLYEEGRVLYADPGFPPGLDSGLAGAQTTGIIELQGLRVFAEKIGVRNRMVICGAGHVAISLLRLASLTGFETWVLEDRGFFADKARENGADHVLTGPFAESISRIPESSGTCYVIMTRAHQYDMECLGAILPRRAIYTGMMCSRSRAADARKLLCAQGMDQEIVDALHAPIGLPIGAETPEEIAVSVMAEVIQTLRGSGTGSIPADILDALKSAEGGAVLAQIVSKEGSAPRSVGTKIVVRADGSFTGTLGGGLLEAEIIRRAREIAAIGGGPALIHTDLSGKQDLGPDWSSCGGEVEIFLEPV